MKRPIWHDDYEEVEQTEVNIEGNRGRVRLTLLASKSERRWAVYGEVVVPLSDNRDRDEYSPKHSYYYVDSKAEIMDAVTTLKMELRREGRRYQRSVDSDAASHFLHKATE